MALTCTLLWKSLSSFAILFDKNSIPNHHSSYFCSFRHSPFLMNVFVLVFSYFHLHLLQNGLLILRLVIGPLNPVFAMVILRHEDTLLNKNLEAHKKQRRIILKSLIILMIKSCRKCNASTL